VNDYISGIAIDSASYAYVVGYTNSKDFPVTSGAYSTVCGPNGQNCAAAHVTKLNPSATSIVWSTFVGDAKPDASDAVFFTGPIQLDGAGNVYIIGQTGGGPGFPMVNPVEPTPTGGDQQVLVAELDPTGSKLLFSTTIGSHGLDTDNPAGLVVDTAGDIYLAGNSYGPDLITTPGAFQTTSSNNPCCRHGFVAKIAPTNPQITAVTDAAGYQPGISPGAWIVIWGANLSSTTRPWQTSEIINGKLPTQLDGVSVTVDGKPAAVYYISPGQLDVQAPDDSTTGSVQVVVTAPQGTATATATMQAASPGLFMYNAGNRNYLAAQHVDYSLVGPSAPAKPGEVIILYATGFGPTTPPTPSGQLVTTAYPVVNLSAITLTIGGSPAQVPLWAGITEAGLWQMNIQVPQGASSGDAAVVAQIGGKSTQSNVFLSIQAP
jgi:uncharacterized protein (TIGR03437 family)